MKMIKQPTIPPMPKQPTFDARDTQYNLPIGKDCISRQAAIDALRDYLVGKRCPDDGTLTCRLIENEVINKLPSAQPEPCEDAVSREVLKDGFTKMCNLICPYTKKQQHVMCGSCLMGTAFDVLEATPSVTPKQRTGKWIKTARWRNVYKCDQCGNYLDFSGVNAGRGDANFCPNCGSRNEVTT